MRDEVRRIAAGENDREEMRMVREQLAAAGGLRSPRRCCPADEFLGLSTLLVVAHVDARALPTSFRPAIGLEGAEMRVPVEQTTVVDPQRLGSSVGRLDATELRSVDEALVLVIGSDA